MGESPIHPARYHDSLGWIADTHDDSALIVARIDSDWGACVIKEPVSEKSSASSKCNICCVSVPSACISALVVTVFNSELTSCVRASSNCEVIACVPCSFRLSNLTVFESGLFFCMRAPSNSDIIGCAQCSFCLSNLTVFEFWLILCVRAPSNYDLIGCAQCSFSLSNMTVFEFWLSLCMRASTNSDVIPCAQWSCDLLVFTVDSLVTESSNSWWLAGWWSVNTHIVFLGDGEYDWWLWWSESFWRDVRVSTQGTRRFPTWDSVLLRNIPALDLLFVAENSF